MKSLFNGKYCVSFTKFHASQIVIPVLSQFIDLTPVVIKFFLPGITRYGYKIDPKTKIGRDDRKSKQIDIEAVAIRYGSK